MSEEMQKPDSGNRKQKPVTYAAELDASTSKAGAGNPANPGELPSFEHLAEVAKSQAVDAAEALREGRIMEDAEADHSATSDDRLIALLCYWSQLVMPLVMPIIVLLSESGKRRSFQRHHAIQSLGLTGGIIGLTLAITMGLGILQIIPIVGFVIAALALCLSPIVFFMIMIAYVFYGWQAHKGKRFSIPILSRFLRRQGWLD